MNKSGTTPYGTLGKQVHGYFLPVSIFHWLNDNYSFPNQHYLVEVHRV